MPTDTLPVLPTSEPAASSTVKCAVCLSFLTPDNPAVAIGAGGAGTQIADGLVSSDGVEGGNQRFAPVGVTLSEEAERRQRDERARNEVVHVGNGEIDGEGRLCRTCAERSRESRPTGTGDAEVDDARGNYGASRMTEERTTNESERVVEDEVMAVGDAVDGNAERDEVIVTSLTNLTSFNSTLAATTSSSTILPSSSSRSVKGSARSASTRSPSAQIPNYPRELLPNPLLDIARLRIPSKGRGALAPGAVFRGTQTSGRSSYEVEVRIVVSLRWSLA